jgi:hypothetical protein
VSCGAFNSFVSHILLICVVSSRGVMVPSIGGYFFYSFKPYSELSAGTFLLIMILKMFIIKLLLCILNMIIGALRTCSDRSVGLATGLLVRTPRNRSSVPGRGSNFPRQHRLKAGQWAAQHFLLTEYQGLILRG